MKYSGVHRLYLNPANAAGRSNPLSVSIVGVGQTYDNTYADWAGDDNILTAILDETSALSSSDFEPRGNELNMAGIGLEARAIGITFGIGPYIGLGFSTRARGDLQIRNASLDFLEAMRIGIDDRRWNLGQEYSNQSFGMNLNVYSEAAVTLAGRPPIIQGDDHKFYIGATLKYLNSQFAGSLNIEDMTFDIDEDNSGNRQMTISSIRGTMGYSSVDADHFSADSLKQLFSNPAGSGWGTDIGIAYERKGSMPGQSYQYRFGVSVIDIGSITYDNPGAEFYSFERDTPIIFFEDDVERFAEEPLEVIKEKLNAEPDAPTYTAYLPTTLIIQADYSILPILYVGAIYNRRIIQEDFSINRGDFAAVIPRLELKHISLAVPLTYKNDFKQLALGTTLRLGPFYVGADNWLGAVTEKNIARTQFYTGFSFNIGSPL
jgi:hypothetical protein